MSNGDSDSPFSDLGEDNFVPISPRPSSSPRVSDDAPEEEKVFRDREGVRFYSLDLQVFLLCFLLVVLFF